MVASEARTGTNPPTPDESDVPSTADGVATRARRVVPHRAMPSGRAVVGGLLVALAATGAFVAARHSRDRVQQRYVVARHDLRTGHALTAADLTTRAAELPDAIAKQSYTSPRLLTGAVVLAPMSAGELVQRGSIADAERQPGRNQLSFGVDVDRAAGGDLRPGDRIAVVLTPAGGDPTVVATDLEVIAVHDSGSAIERAGQLTIVVAADPDQALGVARATNPDLVTVVRTTGVEGADRLSVGDHQGQ